MSNTFLPLPLGTFRFQGYSSDKNISDPSYLAPPSQNCLVTEDGKAESRLGFLPEFSIGVDGSSATAFYHKTYDIAFFALGTAVYYYNFNDNVSYNTGITLTSGTTTRFAEFFGDVYLTNTIDGIYVIRVMRLNDTAANSGDATVTIDMDGGGRIAAFGDIAAGGTADDLRINGTNEQMSSVALATGVVTLSGTLSQSYADNTVAIVVRQYSSLEDPSKIVFWKSRMHIMGFPSASNADQPNNTVMTSQFVSGATVAAGDATDIENIVSFAYGTGGSTKITVGNGGKLTNILGVKDYIYFFLEDRVHATAASDITTSGSAIGATVPIEKDENHGCLNEDSAIAIGSSEIAYITTNRRIMRIRISTDSGAAVTYPDESFDVDIREHLKNMDSDQEGALAFHYIGQRKSIFQIRVMGQWYWFIYDHNIQRRIGSTIIQGAWQPPQHIAPVKSLFERNGVLYGTDATDDTVYSFFTAFTDNLSPIYAIIATGEFNVGNAIVEDAQLEGDINQPSMIKLRAYVTNHSNGKRSGSIKTIDGNDFSYSEDNSISAIAVGDGGVEAETTQIAKWKKEFGVFPSEADRVQIVAENEQDGGWFSITSFALRGKQFSNSFSDSL